MDHTPLSEPDQRSVRYSIIEEFRHPRGKPMIVSMGPHRGLFFNLREICFSNTACEHYSYNGKKREQDVSKSIPVEGKSLSTKVVTEVAAANDVSPLDVPPLYDTIDPEALDALFAGQDRTSGQVSFRYNGCNVTVQSSGQISVQTPPTEHK